MRVVIALGGNALLLRHDKPDAAIQRHHIQAAAAALAPLALEHQLILCHGNGPQIGLLAWESDADSSLSEPYPLDALGAQTQGMIGYWLAQELRNAGVTQPVVTVVTQTVVDLADPAFAAPSKFIGAVYTHEQATRLAADRDWQIAADGAGWRRVVASPAPVRILEESSIRVLLDAGALVICGGGGGIPVAQDRQGRLTGVEAVIDKDFTAAAVAVAMNADELLLLTDVAAVMSGFGTAAATAIDYLTVSEVADLDLPAGSMKPKVQACARFTASTGNRSAIGALDDAAAVLDGSAGTAIIPESSLRSGRLDRAGVESRL